MRGVRLDEGRLTGRCDRQGHGGGTAGGQPVGVVVGEAVRAHEVGRRGIGERAVAVERERAVCGAGDERRGQRRVVRVGVVAQHAGLGDGQGGVLTGVIAVVVRHRRPGVVVETFSVVLADTAAD